MTYSINFSKRPQQNHLDYAAKRTSLILLKETFELHLISVMLKNVFSSDISRGEMVLFILLFLLP